MHASQDPHLASMLEHGQLEYKHAAVEDLISSSSSADNATNSNMKDQFDIVFAMEVVEHVADPQGFLRCLSEIVKVR
jgi:polyprenyldihydroxybenzoate methyltransferase/3-demethylubiquinol 3-O-methyltransferase